MTADLHIKTLEIKDLSIGYKSKDHDIVVGKGLNSTLKSGELVCILGKNGIGKSTLIRTITKVQPLLNGEIYIKGKSFNNYNEMELSKSISLVLTERIPASNLTVYELIALGRQPYTDWLGKLTQSDVDQIEFAIRRTKLNNLIHQRCDELSDGQLQRVMICRALAQNTEIIILDEPTAHLDIQHKIETFKLLKELAYELNKTILISTHEIQFALEIADQLWLMTTKGMITGDPQSLIDNNLIHELFESDNIRFDKHKRQFLIN